MLTIEANVYERLGEQICVSGKYIKYRINVINVPTMIKRTNCPCLVGAFIFFITDDRFMLELCD